MNLIKNRKILILLFLQIFLMSSFISYSVTTTQAKPNSTKTTGSNTNFTNVTSSLQNADLVAIYNPNAATSVNVNGIMGPNEYPEMFYSNYTGMSVAMTYNGTSLFVFVSAPTAGWVGVGFNQLGYGMVGASVEVGAVYNNITGATGTHVYDSNTNTTSIVNSMYATYYGRPSLAEHSVITTYNGTQSLYLNGATGTNRTNLEFVMNMAPNDTQPITAGLTGSNPPITQQKTLTPGDSYSLLLAYGAQADDGGFFANGVAFGGTFVKHVNKTIATLYIAPENIGPRTASKINLHLDQTSGGQNSTFTGLITLTTDNGTPIANASVGIYQVALIGDLNLETVTTNQNGTALVSFNVYLEYSTNLNLQAKFLGDTHYKKDFSDFSVIAYTGSVPHTTAPFLYIPTSFDFLMPWLTGLGAVSAVAGIWMAFGYVVYTVIYKNAVQPSTKKSKGE